MHGEKPQSPSDSANVPYVRCSKSLSPFLKRRYLKLTADYKWQALRASRTFECFIGSWCASIFCKNVRLHEFPSKKTPFSCILNVSRMFHGTFHLPKEIVIFLKVEISTFSRNGFLLHFLLQGKIPLYGIFYAPTASKFAIFRVNIHFAISRPCAHPAAVKRAYRRRLLFPLLIH